MPINITMPALSPTMEEGKLAKWTVKPGDKIKSGMIIAEIESSEVALGWGPHIPAKTLDAALRDCEGMR